MHSRKLSSKQIADMFNGIWTYHTDLSSKEHHSKEDLLVSVYFVSTHKKGYLYQLVLGENDIYNCLYRIEKYSFRQFKDEKTGKLIPTLVVKNFRPETDETNKELLFEKFSNFANEYDIDITHLKMPTKVTTEFIKNNYLPKLVMLAT